MDHGQFDVSTKEEEPSFNVKTLIKRLAVEKPVKVPSHLLVKMTTFNNKKLFDSSNDNSPESYSKVPTSMNQSGAGMYKNKRI